MIAYDLICCDGDHAFEGWFGSAADYHDQKDSGLLTCPICGSAHVEKALSVPNVGRKGNQLISAPAVTTTPEAPEIEAAPPSGMMASGNPLSEKAREMLSKIAKAQAEAIKSSEYVGDKFVDTVRAQHYGEADKAPVHGEANLKDAADLAEEGINVMPILFPYVPPKSQN